MTTIIYDHKSKSIAYDSRLTCGNCISTDFYSKKYKLKNGGIMFASGTVSDIQKFAEEYPDLKSYDLDFNAFIVKGSNVFKCSFYDERYNEVSLSWCEAIGSGGDFAISALDLGKSAIESVEFAATKDAYTGGDVNCYCMSSIIESN